MGRGRAKAKQRKVARELKYYAPNSDLSALEQELRGSTGRSELHDEVETEDEDDEYSEYEDRWATDEDDEEEDERR